MLNVEKLKQLQPLDSISGEHLPELVRQFTEAQVRKGDFLFKAGDQSPVTFFLLKGDLGAGLSRFTITIDQGQQS